MSEKKEINLISVAPNLKSKFVDYLKKNLSPFKISLVLWCFWAILKLILYMKDLFDKDW